MAHRAESRGSASPLRAGCSRDVALALALSLSLSFSLSQGTELTLTISPRGLSARSLTVLSSVLSVWWDLHRSWLVDGADLPTSLIHTDRLGPARSLAGGPRCPAALRGRCQWRLRHAACNVLYCVVPGQPAVMEQPAGSGDRAVPYCGTASARLTPSER